MCKIDRDALTDLLASVKAVQPYPGATDTELAWHRGTIHGIALSINHVKSEHFPVAVNKPRRKYGLILLLLLLSIFAIVYMIGVLAEANTHAYEVSRIREQPYWHIFKRPIWTGEKEN